MEPRIEGEQHIFDINKEGVKFNVSFTYMQGKGKWNYCTENFEIVFLQNPYFEKEIDVFELYLDEDSQRCGFIIPISAIESDASTEENDNHIVEYKYCAFRKIIEKIVEYEMYDINKNHQLISECVKASNTFVLIINKHSKNDFLIEDYLYSFAKTGFYIWDRNSEVRKVFENPIIEKERIKVKKCKSSLFKEFPYIKDLLENYLKITDDFLARFILLYQVIELFIEKEGRDWLNECIINFKIQDARTVNDFQREIQKITKEDARIKKIFEKNNIDKDDSDRFKSACINLFRKINFTAEDENLMPSLLYDLRNKIFHSYRTLSQYDIELNSAIHMFELIILDLLIEVNIETKINEIQ